MLTGIADCFQTQITAGNSTGTINFSPAATLYTTQIAISHYGSSGATLDIYININGNKIFENQLAGNTQFKITAPLVFKEITTLTVGTTTGGGVPAGNTLHCGITAYNFTSASSNVKNNLVTQRTVINAANTYFDISPTVPSGKMLKVKSIIFTNDNASLNSSIYNYVDDTLYFPVVVSTTASAVFNGVIASFCIKSTSKARATSVEHPIIVYLSGSYLDD